MDNLNKIINRYSTELAYEVNKRINLEVSYENSIIENQMLKKFMDEKGILVEFEKMREEKIKKEEKDDNVQSNA